MDGEGRLILEEIGSVDELTDGDFTEPKRSVRLPQVSVNVDKALGANGKPIIIKKNILEKNRANHPELTPAQSKEILTEALYLTNLYGQTQPKSRHNYWVAIRTSDPNRVVVLEVAEGKDNVEIVGWRYAGVRQLEEMRKQAEREDGQLLILTSEKEAAAGLSTLPSDVSTNKGSENTGNAQGGVDEVEPGVPATASPRTETEAEQAREHRAGGTEAVRDAVDEAVSAWLDEVLRATFGADYVTDAAEGQRVLDAAKRAEETLREMGKRKSASETALPEGETSFKGTVISSADAAKIVQNLETLAKTYENISGSRKNFLDELGTVIGSQHYGSGSQYADFEAANGQMFTIRLADHNAHTSGFDYEGQDNGISIVITPKNNLGINNDGEAHIVEFYYNAIKLRKAEGHPYAQIVFD